MARIKGDHAFTRLWLSANDTYDWAHRPRAQWPCSTLAGHRVYAEFQNGDLVDLRVDGRWNGRTAERIDGDEFNAMTSDFLREKCGPDHPGIRS